ncbi:hypothetical protein B0H39_002485 [Clostridium beijerinckii]|uniref:SprT-like domain-containing protein n=1 Tax=Clostridium beijerinckii TaxID=1520 RepID=UPI0014949D5A|nr:hypothetical protein [Clostridium beijerinckii]
MISYDIKFLEKAFNIFNSVYFEGKLPQVALTIQSSPKSFAYITTQKVWEDTKGSYFELNLSAEYLNRDIANVLASLLHEAVHLWNIINNVKDTSNLGRYHNKHFKTACEARDLIIEHAPVIGWSVTKPSENFINVIKQHGLYEPIEHSRITMENGKRPKRPSSTSKYICDSCGISVRATKSNIRVQCMDCKMQLRKVE